MKLILVRHGISEDNVGDLISGGESNPNLSAEGINNVKKISQFVDENKIDLVYASPLTRAYETAKLLTKGNKKIIEDKRLVEMDFGQWEGKAAKPLMKLYPDAFDYTGMFSPDFVKYAPGAESYYDLILRCASFFNDLKVVGKAKTVMVVCHGFIIRGFMADLFHLDITEVGSVNNVSFTEIDFNEKAFWQPRLMSFNREKPVYYAVKK